MKKIILIVLNFIVLGLCILWVKKEGGTEPYVAISLQVISLITLFSPNSLSIKNIKNNSEIDLKEKSKSNSHTDISDVDNSKIKIRRK